MTPAQVKGPKPVDDFLTDVRTQIVGAVLALQAVGYVVMSPTQQIKQIHATTASEIAATRAEIREQRLRIDSLSISIRQVRSLVQVKCVETRTPIIRQMLECDR